MSLKNTIFGGALAAAFCGLFATDLSAAMRYDLRFADGTKDKPAVPGSYTLNLYGVIDRGNDVYTDDSITGGFVNIYSGTLGNGGIAPGTNSGITASAFSSAIAPLQSLLGKGADLRTNPNFSVFTQEPDNTDIAAPASSKDGILDWGSDQSYFGSLAFAAPNQGFQAYTQDGLSTAAQAQSSYKYGFSPPFVPGGAVGAASATLPNAWEVLLGTFTVQVNGVLAGGPNDKTSFSPFIYHRVRTTNSAGTAADGMTYNQDGSTTPPGRAVTRLMDIPSLFGGVTFTAGIPEPSTLVMCGLAAIGSVFALRRRGKV